MTERREALMSTDTRALGSCVINFDTGSFLNENQRN